MTAAPTGFNVAARAVRWTTYALLAICGLLIVAALFTLAAEIVLRYAFAAPMSHIHELTMIGFTFVYLFGAGALYARNDDIVIEFFVRRMPRVVSQVVVFVIYLAIVAAMAVVLWQSIALMQRQMNIPTPSLRIPQAIYALPLAITAAFIALCSLVEAWASAVALLGGERPRVWPSHLLEDDYETESM